MTSTRYPQSCSLARAAEILGERWTLLIVRELLFRPQRFTDLRRRLDGVSTSVLSQRLAHLESDGIIRHVPSTPGEAPSVYVLTPDGEDLRPSVLALVSWGLRFLNPEHPGERFEPEWAALTMEATARREPVPTVSLALRATGGEQGEDIETFYIIGGEHGTTVTRQPSPAQAVITAEGRTLMTLATGERPLAKAVARGQVTVEGDMEAASHLPELFHTQLQRRADA